MPQVRTFPAPFHQASAAGARQPLQKLQDQTLQGDAFGADEGGIES